jgi:hypothetical protein
MIENESRTVEFMIRYYCCKQHKKAKICTDCQDLIKFTEEKLISCRYGEDKPACKNCKTHCYSKYYREKIIEVMRFAGPRMIFVNPIMAVEHLFRNMRRVNN